LNLSERKSGSEKKGDLASLPFILSEMGSHRKISSRADFCFLKGHFAVLRIQ
jgi:hypothetical protein